MRLSFAPCLRMISGAEYPVYNMLYVREVMKIGLGEKCRRPVSGESGDITSQE